MTDSSPETRHGKASDGHPGLPGWVKLLGIGAVVVVVVLVLVMLLVGGEHGPGMHGG